MDNIYFGSYYYSRSCFSLATLDRIRSKHKKNNQLKDEQAKLEKSFDEISDEIDDLKNKNINLKTKYETLKCAVKSLGSDVEKIDKNEKLHWVETTDSDGNTSGCITIDPSDNDIFVYQNSLEWLCGDC